MEPVAGGDGGAIPQITPDSAATYLVDLRPLVLHVLVIDLEFLRYLSISQNSISIYGKSGHTYDFGLDRYNFNGCRFPFRWFLGNRCLLDDFFSLRCRSLGTSSSTSRLGISRFATSCSSSTSSELYLAFVGYTHNLGVRSVLQVIFNVLMCKLLIFWFISDSLMSNRKYVKPMSIQCVDPPRQTIGQKVGFLS